MVIKFKKLHTDAVIPTKAHPTDAGFDLKICPKRHEAFKLSEAIKVEKVRNTAGNNVTIYIFLCKKCNGEMRKTAHYARHCTGYCLNCTKNLKKKVPETRTEKTCIKCNNLKLISEFRIRDGQADNSCQKCKNLLAAFDINSDDYDKILKSQDNRCAICKSEKSHVHNKGKEADLAVDHCHRTGKVRGLLCSRCNMGIGMFKEDTAVLMAAIKYIKKVA